MDDRRFRSIADDYRRQFPRSAERHAVARQLLPGGVAHDGRHLAPFPVYVDEAAGAVKRTIDGRDLVDFGMGHGALLLGHGSPDVVAAVERQLRRGTHFSACHELEIEWASRVQSLVPSAERVRFTSSGTEATLMAIRLARAFTRREGIVKLIGHFHGWHDGVLPAAYSPYTPESWNQPGLAPGVVDHLSLIPPNDLDALESAFSRQSPAAFILEPTGGHWSMVPLQRNYLRNVRDLCSRYGVVLIFDEVITGFRVSPGGAQARSGVLPDLTTLAKILAGGLPGGAVAGRADILQLLEFDNALGRKVRHPGTFNANPLSAAAGCATLATIASGEPGRVAESAAVSLRSRLNRLFRDQRIGWTAYGDSSMTWILPTDDRLEWREGDLPCDGDVHRLDGPRDPALATAFRQALLLEGVDWFGWGGMTSAAHSAEVIDRAVTAFAAALDRLDRAGYVVPGAV